MIIPSIDIIGGNAVQLRGGEEMLIDAGDPRPLLERFGVVGEVAVVDIDAARGEGDNRALIEELCRMGPVRVGGGIRDADSALRWLDAGAEKVVIGTSAHPDLLRRLPRERVVVAVDSVNGEVVTHGWRRRSGRRLNEALGELSRWCGGFLVTFVELEGRLGGADLERARQAVEAAGDTRVTVAGGVISADEIAALDRIGADAQVGMALYTGRLDLSAAFAAPLISDREDGLWPTVVTDEHGVALGLAWSSGASLRQAIETRRGVYHSRSRGLWVKGETSGATQDLIAVSADCDRDALRFRVRQGDSGFCHTASRTCWGEDHGLTRLARRLADIATVAPPGSNTARLLKDPDLLAAKLVEEARELAAAKGPTEVTAETADLLYFALVRMVAEGLTLKDVEDVLDGRERGGTRRPMMAKELS
ncbi:MAG: phosphoribosyl-ATP diphosphatase [Acidimicrobiia bacterium]